MSSPYAYVRYIYIFIHIVGYLRHVRIVRLRNSRRSGVFPVPCQGQPTRAEESQAVNESLFASRRLTSCCQATAVNTWMTWEGERSRDRASSDITR
jgi:hypothetical protein